MKVTCPKCGAEYNVQSDRIPSTGIDMKCSKCLHTFRLNVNQPAPPRGGGLDLQGVTFLGAGPSVGNTNAPSPQPSGFFIQKSSGKIFGPYEKSLIREMIRTDKLNQSDQISQDKASWQPLASIPEFAPLLTQNDAANNSTQFGRPGGNLNQPPESSPNLGAFGASGFALGQSNDPAMPDLGSDFSFEFGSGADFEVYQPSGDQDAFDNIDLPRPAGLSAELPRPAGLSAELPRPAGLSAELPRPAGLSAELPRPAGLGAELPRSTGFGAELPMSSGRGAELPLSSGRGAELPRSTGFGAELPSPSGRGVDMPRPVGGELPNPIGAAPPRSAGGSISLGGPPPMPQDNGDSLFQDDPGDDLGDFGGDDWGAPADDDGLGFASEFDEGAIGFSTEANVDLSSGAVGFDDPDAGFGNPGFGAPPPTPEPEAPSYAGSSLPFGTAADDDPFGAPPAAPEPPPAAPPLPAPPPEPEAAAPAQVPQQAQAPQGKGKSKATLGIVIGLLVIALLVIGGAIITQTDLLGGDSKTPDPNAGKGGTKIVTPASKTGFDALKPATHAAYKSFIESTRKRLSAKPSDVGLQGQLMTAYALYLAAYPEDKQYRKEATALAQKIKGGDGDAGKLAAGAKAVYMVNDAEAQKQLEALTSSDDHGYISHLLLGVLGTLDPPASAKKADKDDGAKKDDAKKEAKADDDAKKDDEDAAKDDAAKDDAAKAEGDSKADDGKADDGKADEGGDEIAIEDGDGGDAAKAEGDGGDDGGDEDSAKDDAPKPKDSGDDDMAFDMDTSDTTRANYSLDHLKAAAKADPEAPAPHYFMAAIHQRLGDLKAAGNSLDQALKINKDHIPSMIQRGRIAYLSGDLDSAEVYTGPIQTKLASKASAKERSQALLVKGLIHVAKRQSSDAIKTLTEALKVDPTNTEALKALGNEFFRNKNYKEALTYFSTNKGLSQTDPDVMLNVVKSNIGLEKFDAAVTQLQKGTKSFPEDPRFPYYLGLIQEREGNWFEARERFRNAVQIDPTFVKARIRLGMILMRDNRKTEAEEMFREVERQGATRNEEVAVDLAQAYLMMGKTKRAVGLLNNVLKRNASNLEARLRLARYYLDQKQSGKAYSLLKPFLDSDIKDDQLTMLMADVLREQGKYTRSIELLDRLIESYPNNPEYIFKRGLAYFAWENYDTANANFLKAFEIKPANKEPYFYAGRVALAKNDFRQALKIFRSVLDADRNNGEYRFYLGLALERNGMLPQALEEYSLMDRYAPDYGKTNPEFYYRRGLIYSKQGKNRRAKDDLVNALRQDPKHLGSLLALGDTLYDERQYDQAIELYQRALRQRSDLSRAYYQLGRAQAYLKRLPEATASLEKAIENGMNKDPELHKTIGLIYREQGNRGAALGHFKRYVELTPDERDRSEIRRYIKSVGGTL